MATTSTAWISLSCVPGLPVNRKIGCQFAIAFNEKTNGLYALVPSKHELRLTRYSFESNSWCTVHVTPSVKYIRDDSMSYKNELRATAAMDCDSNTIYFWYPKHGSNNTNILGDVAKIQLLKDSDGVISAKSVMIPFAHRMTRSPQGVFMENKIHLFGSGEHHTYDVETKQWIVGSYKHLIVPWESAGRATVKNKNKVLVFVGPVLEYDISNGEWTPIMQKRRDFTDGKWTNPPTTFLLSQGGGYTPILNGDYVLLFGGRTVYCNGNIDNFDHIQIYSVIHHSIRKSRIKCPRPHGECHAVSVRDKRREQLAASGYTRREWKECGIADHLFPPIHILSLIAAWYWSEFVHIFCADQWEGKGQHFKIDVFDIIQS